MAARPVRFLAEITVNPFPETHSGADARQTPFEAEVARLIITSLHLESPAEEIAAEAPLFGEGLELDSIDALELALAISRDYGFELRSDDERNQAIFANLRSLAAHVAGHRTR